MSCSAQTPPTTANAVAISTSIRLRGRPGDEAGDHCFASLADGAVRALQGGVEVAFGIDEEVAVDDDAVAVLDAFQNLHVVAAAPAELDVTGFEPAIAQIDDDDLPATAVDH